MKSQKNKNTLATIMLIVFFTILAILIIIPIYTIFLASFKPGGDLLQYGLNLGIDWGRMSRSASDPVHSSGGSDASII